MLRTPATSTISFFGVVIYSILKRKSCNAINSQVGCFKSYHLAQWLTHDPDVGSTCSYQISQIGRALIPAIYLLNSTNADTSARQNVLDALHTSIGLLQELSLRYPASQRSLEILETSRRSLGLESAPPLGPLAGVQPSETAILFSSNCKSPALDEPRPSD